MNTFWLAFLSSVACVSSAVIFSPYKDVGINLNWNNYVISSQVTGAERPITQILPTGVNAVTWAFAVGTCGSETWVTYNGQVFATANIANFVNAGVKYIISTGGAAGGFKCASNTDFDTFVQRYTSPSLLGFDFDIEAGWLTNAEITSLVGCIAAAKAKNPSLRMSFTLASLGGDSNPILGSQGQAVLAAVQATGMKDYIINLMAMDYGSTGPWNCVVVASKCQMGLSAVKAAQQLHAQTGLPYSQIELTPMIGLNDTPDEVFTLDDATTVAAFAAANGLAGVHFWSFDRDSQCDLPYVSNTCSSFNQGGILGFTKAFVAKLRSSSANARPSDL